MTCVVDRGHPVETKRPSIVAKVDVKVDIKSEYAKIDWVMQNGSIFIALKYGYVTTNNLLRWVINRAAKESIPPTVTVALRALDVVYRHNDTFYDDPRKKLSKDEMTRQQGVLEVQVPEYRKMFPIDLPTEFKYEIASTPPYRTMLGANIVSALSHIERVRQFSDTKGPIDKTRVFIDAMDCPDNTMTEMLHVLSAINPFDKEERKRLRVWMNKTSSQLHRSHGDDAKYFVFELLLRHDLTTMMGEELIVGHSTHPMANLLEHCYQLRHGDAQSRSYWPGCAYYEYSRIVEHLIKGGWITRRDMVDASDIKQLTELFPAMFDGSPIARNIELARSRLLSNDGWIPFCILDSFGSSSVSVRHSELDQLYYLIESVPTAWTKYLSSSFRFADRSKLYNDEDTLMESIAEYSEFDCIVIPARGVAAGGLHPPLIPCKGVAPLLNPAGGERGTESPCWVITRPEWEFILKTGQNPYNRTPLPQTILDEMSRRLKTVRIDRLPQIAVPLRILVQQILETAKRTLIGDAVTFPWEGVV